MAMQNMPRSRVAGVAGLLLRELELHSPAEDCHRLNMFGGPCTDLGDEGCRNDAPTPVTSNPLDSNGLWPRKRRMSERDAAFGLSTSVDLGAYLGIMESRREIVTTLWKTGLEGVWYKV